MDSLEFALERLRSSWATFAIPEKVREPRYDRELGARVCALMFQKCGRCPETFARAVDDFIALSEEFVRLQIDLDRTGRYAATSFADVRAAVYDNPAVMEGRYLNGLFLSQAFWINHTKLFAFFCERFAAGNPRTGAVLEVPCGTGFYVCEFLLRNPSWSGEALDLSASSVAFASETARLSDIRSVTIRRADIFALREDLRYDRIICGELLEHLEEPAPLLAKLRSLLAEDGRLFLTTAIWAASIDHIFLFESASEVRSMLADYFTIECDIVVNVREEQCPNQARVPMSYAAVLAARGPR